MKSTITLLFSFFLFACTSHSAKPATEQKISLVKGLSCDSLIQNLVRKGDGDIQSWYEMKVVKLTNDSIMIKVFATNQGRDTNIVSWIILLPKSNELKDITLYPMVKNFEIDRETMELIRYNCLSFK